MAQTHTAHGSIGRASVIFADDNTSYSRYTNLRNVDAHTLRGATVGWPRCTETGEQPLRGQKLAISGGHIDLLDEEAFRASGAWIIATPYSVGIVRTILRATQRHFGSNLHYRQSRHSYDSFPMKSCCGGRPIPPADARVVDVRSIFPHMTQRYCGGDMLSAMLSGISHRGRPR